LHGPRRKHSLSIVGKTCLQSRCLFVAAGMCLPNCCLVMNVYSDFAISAFGRHITIHTYVHIHTYLHKPTNVHNSYSLKEVCNSCVSLVLDLCTVSPCRCVIHLMVYASKCLRCFVVTLYTCSICSLLQSIISSIN
jgi:hypothetical protein